MPLNFFLQLIGFVILLIGMACYNNIVIPQLVKNYLNRLGRNTTESEDRIINTAADDIQDTI